MTSKRDDFWDVVKGFSILLVVLGHSINYGNGADYLRSEVFYDNILFKIIYSFHMPIFMIVSGYLFYYSLNRRTISEILLSRIRMLLVPLFAFALIYKIPVIVSTLRGMTSFQFLLYDYLQSTILGYHLWFLWSVFLNSILVMLVVKFKLPQFSYLFIWICSLFPTAHAGFFTGMELFSFMYPFFVIGFMFHQYGNSKWFDDVRIQKLSGLIYIILLFFYNRDTYIYTSGQSILRNNGSYIFLLDVQRFLTGFFGSVFFINALRCLYVRFGNYRLFRFLTVLGVNSMGIYCFHHIFLWQFIKHVMVHIHINYCSFPLTLLTFIAALTFSVVCTFFAKRFYFSNCLFLGGR